jgi:hypothetical protein
VIGRLIFRPLQLACAKFSVGKKRGEVLFDPALLYSALLCSAMRTVIRFRPCFASASLPSHPTIRPSDHPRKSEKIPKPKKRKRKGVYQHLDQNQQPKNPKPPGKHPHQNPLPIFTSLPPSSKSLSPSTSLLESASTLNSIFLSIPIVLKCNGTSSLS